MTIATSLTSLTASIANALDKINIEITALNADKLDNADNFDPLASGLAATSIANALYELKTIIDNLGTTYATDAELLADVNTINASWTAADTALNNLIATKFSSADFSGANILAQLLTVDGATSGLDSELLAGNPVVFFAPQSDTFTKAEVTALNDAIISDRIWKASVATFADLATTYPSPLESWTASVDDVDVLYRYDGTAWQAIAGGIVPLATAVLDGKISAADFNKLAAIESGATADQTDAEIKAAYEANADTNAYDDAAVSKLGAIESSATADQSASEIKIAYEANLDTNAFSDAEQTKLAAIEANATGDQSDAEVKLAYEANANTNAFTDANQTKLATIETGAEANLTDAEIKISYEANLDTNAFDDAEQAKLAAIEDSATADQSGAEIKAAYEANANTNEFNDTEKSKLAAIEIAATADQTPAEILAAVKTVDGATSGLDSQYFAGNPVVFFAPQSDTYTKAEIVAMHDSIVSDRIWKPAVANFAALAITYPTPVEGWTASVNDVDKLYRYDGTAWEIIASGVVPLATETIDGQMSSGHFYKLENIENNATADQTAAEIKSAYESNANTNEFGDAEQLKLGGIETGATGDQTAGEIKSAYEGNADTNAFTDTLLAKLNSVESGATGDLTAAEINALLTTEGLTTSSITVTDGYTGIAWEGGRSRITHNDGGGNCQMRFGHKYDNGSERYTAALSSAMRIRQDIDTEGSPLMITVGNDVGVADGDAITWGQTWSQYHDRVTFGSMVITSAGEFNGVSEHANNLGGIPAADYLTVDSVIDCGTV